MKPKTVNKICPKCLGLPYYHRLGKPCPTCKGTGLAPQPNNDITICPYCNTAKHPEHVEICSDSQNKDFHGWTWDSVNREWVSPQPNSADGVLEPVLEQVWLDGASLAGGAYLGKKTMRVSEAKEALLAWRRSTVVAELEQIANLTPCAGHEGEPHTCAEWIRDNAKQRIAELNDAAIEKWKEEGK